MLNTTDSRLQRKLAVCQQYGVAGLKMAKGAITGMLMQQILVMHMTGCRPLGTEQPQYQ